jgi:hypothetical protein
MAKSDPSPDSFRSTITIPEVHSLAGRLMARGKTVLGIPEQQGDLRLAAKALLAMTRSFNRHDVLDLEMEVQT